MKKLVLVMGAVLTATLLVITSVIPVMAQQPDPAATCAGGMCAASEPGEPHRVQVGVPAVPESEAGMREEGMGGAVSTP